MSLLDRMQSAGMLLKARERRERPPRFACPLAAHVATAGGALLLECRCEFGACIDAALVGTTELERAHELGARLRAVEGDVQQELQVAVLSRARTHRRAVASVADEDVAEGRLCALIALLAEQLGVLRQELLPHTLAAEAAQQLATSERAEQVRAAERCEAVAQQIQQLAEQISEGDARHAELVESISRAATHVQPGSAGSLPTMMTERDRLAASLEEQRRAAAACEASAVDEQALAAQAAEAAEAAECDAAEAWRSAHAAVGGAWLGQLRHRASRVTLEQLLREKAEVVEVRCGNGRQLLPEPVAARPPAPRGSRPDALGLCLPYQHAVTDAVRRALFGGGEGECGVFATVGSAESGRVSTVLVAAATAAIEVTVIDGSEKRSRASLTEAAQRLREGAEQRWPQQELLLVDDADHLPAPVLAGLVEAAVEGVSRRAQDHPGRYPLPATLCLSWSDASLLDQPAEVRAALEAAVPATSENCVVVTALPRESQLCLALAMEGFCFWQALARALDESLPTGFMPRHSPCRELLAAAGELLRSSSPAQPLSAAELRESQREQSQRLSQREEMRSQEREMERRRLAAKRKEDGSEARIEAAVLVIQHGRREANRRRQSKREKEEAEDAAWEVEAQLKAATAREQWKGLPEGSLLEQMGRGWDEEGAQREAAAIEAAVEGTVGVQVSLPLLAQLLRVVSLIW